MNIAEHISYKKKNVPAPGEAVLYFNGEAIGKVQPISIHSVANAERASNIGFSPRMTRGFSGELTLESINIEALGVRR